MQSVTVGDVKIGPGQPLAIIAGPCVAESTDLCLRIGQAMRDRCIELGFSYVFKASFDKANRSSITSDRGPGLDEGLAMLQHVKTELGVAVTTDIHEPSQAQPVGQAADMLQIPAFLCRQTDLLAAAAATGKSVNAKKGQFMAPVEMGNVVHKLRQGAQTVSGNSGSDSGVILTERGTFFGYHRLVNDFVGLGDLMEMGCPVCFDVTHSTQQPGGGGTTSGGRPDRASLLARCAVVAGVHALFIETHPDPAKALSDAATMLDLEQASTLLEQVSHLRQAMGAMTT